MYGLSGREQARCKILQGMWRALVGILRHQSTCDVQPVRGPLGGRGKVLSGLRYANGKACRAGSEE
ncbi:hypothetical protein GCM10027296_14370 [Chitinimonas naiadis]